MEEVMEHVVEAGSGEGILEVLVPRLIESKRRIELNMEKATQVVSEKSDLVGASNKLPSDSKTIDIFEETYEEFVNTEAQLLHDVLGEGIAQDSELSPTLESANMTANVEFDSEDEISTSTLFPVSIDSQMVEQDASILGISPSSSLAESDQELITEISMAVEEMRSIGSVGDGAFQPGESHTILVPSHLTIAPSDITLVRTWLGLPCAVKRFQSAYSRELVSILKQELDILIKLHHPHIVMLMGCSFDSQQRCSIVMEMMSGSLRSLIDSQMLKRKENHSSTPIVPFAPSEALDIIKQITLGMVCLHSNGIIHRDMKSDNVLVRDLGHGKWEVKIVDFGASLNIDSSGMRIGVGTGFWRAPEVLPAKATDRLSKPDLEAADVYSLAMTFYEVLTGEVPFHDALSTGQLKPNDFEKVIKGLRPKLPSNLDGHLTRLIKSCWDPRERPNIKNICEQLFCGSAIVESSASRPFSQVPKALGIIEC